MKNTTRIAGLALATLIGFGTLGAQAAPFAASAGTTAGVETGIEQVRDRGDHRGRHGDRHRGNRRHHGHDRGHGFRHHRWYPSCYWKRVRVYDPFFDAYVIESRQFCR